MHCHQVKEAIDSNLMRTGKWSRDQFWRYPLPENLGITLEVDRGNVVSKIAEKSPAATTGLKPGDMVTRLNGVPVHSFGDAQQALDRAPLSGTIPLAYQRGDRKIDGKLELPQGWRKTDVTWRSSVNRYLPYARVYGPDLSVEEKKALGLGPKQLAFRQKNLLTQQAKAAGVQAGDIIFGADDQLLEMDAGGFVNYIQRNYFIGDKVKLNIFREGKRMDIIMMLVR
jgi:S1-C subfamily serine protease